MAFDQFGAFVARSFSQLIAKRPRDCVFSMAARGDDAGLQEEIRPYGFVDANEELGHGIRMLHLASYYGHDNVVRLLVRRGATDSRAGAHPYRFWTALHFAVFSGSPECLRALKPTFEKLQRRDTYNISCIHIASHFGRVAIIDEMLAMAPNDHSRMKMLNEEGHVKGDDKFGNTPLDEACAGKQWACMKHLLSLGATYLHTDKVKLDLLEASEASDQASPTATAEGDEKDCHVDSAKRLKVDRSEPDDQLCLAARRPAHANAGTVTPPEEEDGEDARPHCDAADPSGSVWQQRFEDLAKLAIASGIDRDRVRLLFFPRPAAHSTLSTPQVDLIRSSRLV